ncbi:single-strand binding protein [Allomuricauda ruestringensis DSM 13258]|uniref:Single-stranded DNA-binding protein n=2 Tax=Flagellimonas TaxID=444459 RepID=G2PQ85_ALLRU|nr:single-strand binding protein [Allomuricauda ruestringensis DSM 13258]
MTKENGGNLLTSLPLYQMDVEGRHLKLFIMSTLRNKVQLIGNVGQDPVITDLDGGKRVARLTLATNEHYKNKQGERVTNTEWHTLIGWGKLADIIEGFVTKGKEIAIEGKLTSRSYEDKEGNKRYVTEVVLSEILLLGGTTNEE